MTLRSSFPTGQINRLIEIVEPWMVDTFPTDPEKYKTYAIELAKECAKYQFGEDYTTEETLIFSKASRYMAQLVCQHVLTKMVVQADNKFAELLIKEKAVAELIANREAVEKFNQQYLDDIEHNTSKGFFVFDHEAKQIQRDFPLTLKNLFGRDFNVVWDISCLSCYCCSTIINQIVEQLILSEFKDDILLILQIFRTRILPSPNGKGFKMPVVDERFPESETSYRLVSSTIDSTRMCSFSDGVPLWVDSTTKQKYWLRPFSSSKIFSDLYEKGDMRYWRNSCQKYTADAIARGVVTPSEYKDEPDNFDTVFPVVDPSHFDYQKDSEGLIIERYGIYCGYYGNERFIFLGIMLEELRQTLATMDLSKYPKAELA